MNQPSEQVWINGATVEREYARCMLHDVLQSRWKRVSIDAHAGDHVHCCMCEIAMEANQGLQAFQDGTNWLCDACWARFIYFAERL